MDKEQVNDRVTLATIGSGAASALFEADGSAWKLQAIEMIAAYLRARLPEALTVIA